MAETVVLKRCCTCRIEKDRSAFGKTDPRCLQCRRAKNKDRSQDPVFKATRSARAKTPHAKAIARAWRAKNPDKLRRHILNYETSERGKASRQAYLKSQVRKDAWLRANKKRAKTDKVKARAAVVRAVKLNRIPAARECTCRCGKQAESYHHHLGYSLEHRLHVIPLCKPCHKEADRKR